MANLRTLANPFEFNGHDLRVAVNDKGEVLFNADDIADSLGFDKNSADEAIRLIPGNWRYSLPETSLLFINEAAVFKLIFHYQSENAVSLAEWIVHEVLSTLRKNDFFNEVNPTLRLETSRTIADLSIQIMTNRSDHIRDVLVAELRDCCNLIGRKMPASIENSRLHF